MATTVADIIVDLMGASMSKLTSSAGEDKEHSGLAVPLACLVSFFVAHEVCYRHLWHFQLAQI
jgi:hypothetical protein